MLLKFTKMQSLGHDMMVVNAVTQKVFFSADKVRRLAHRHFGVGFEMMVLIEPPYDPELDFHYQLISADGETVESYSHAAACCCMRFVVEHKLTSKRTINVSSAHSHQTLTLNDNMTVTVQKFEDTPAMTSSCERIYEGTLVID